MKKILLLIIVFSSATILLTAQNVEWVKQIGGPGSESSLSMCLDDNGNIYSTGTFTGVVDFDPGMDTFKMGMTGKTLVFVSKMDPKGDFLWAKQLNLFPNYPLLNEALKINIDASGSVYLTGVFEGKVDFDPGPDSTFLNSNAHPTTFISKMDSSGIFLWVKKFDGKIWTDESKISSIAFDNQNNIYTTGFFSGTIDFNPATDTFNLSSDGPEDIFISKIDAQGNFVWAKRMGGEDYDAGESIQVDSYGNIYIAGYFYETADLDPNSGIYNLNTDFYGFAYFLVKLNPNGSLNWAETIGSSNYFLPAELILDANYNIYLTGTFDGSMDVDPSEETHYLNSYGNNAFVLKLDNYGNLLWVNTLGSRDSNRVNSIAVDAAYNVYITGYIKGSSEFGTDSLHPNGSHDAYISKINSAGDFEWAELFEGPGLDKGISLGVDGRNNIYTTGHFEQTSDFNPWGGSSNLTSNGITDIFIHKINQCDSVKTNETINSCEPYSWNGVRLDSSSIYIDTLQSIVGCDSIVILDLTITQIDTSISFNSPKLTANSTVGTYQWIDCNEGQAIAGETSKTFIPDTNGFYAVVVTEGSCSDTSACYAVVNAGLKEISHNIQVSVLPNPTSHSVSLHFDEQLQNATIKIINTTGKILFIQTGFNRKSETIDLSNFSDGLYFLMVEEEGKRFSSKIVKQ